MTQVATPKLHSLWYPGLSSSTLSYNLPNISSLGPIDAAAEKLLIAGYVSMQGDASGAKTISSAGGTIGFAVNTVTWATAGSTIRVGLQDPDPTAVMTQPDGTFDVYADLVQGTDSLPGSSWKTVAMATGSKSLSHGDVVCIVLDFTTRNGADSLSLFMSTAYLPQITSTVRNYTTSWQSPIAVSPNALLTFDDGTKAIIAGGFAVATVSTLETFSNSTNPDERGIPLYVPWHCKANAARFYARTQGAVAADFDVRIYSDPLGTPTQLVSTSVEGAYSSATSSQVRECLIPFAPVTLSPGWYGVVLKATGTGSIALSSTTVADASYKDLFGACSKITRNDETGAFTEDNTSTYLGFALSLSSIDSGQPRPSLQIGI